MTVPWSIALPAVVLVGALLYAAYLDWTAREVDDAVWLLAALAGAAIGVVVLAPGGALPLATWILASAFVIEHVLPWDVSVEKVDPSLPGLLELGLYVVVVLLLAVVGFVYGVGPTALPVETIAVVVSVIFARALFEFGVLYGGADAKAVMVAGLVLPLDASPFVPVPTAAGSILTIYPFTLTLLMDAAVFAIAIPLYLGVRNARRGSLEFPRAFTSYRLPVTELPYRFVWLRDPAHPRDPSEEEAVETAEEDAALRARQSEELLRQGVREVWVTPQLPFIILLAVGAITGILLGNLLFDLFALL